MFPNSYCAIALTTFLVYDWLGAFPREVRSYWTRRPGTLSTCLYFSIRYIPITAQLYSTYHQFRALSYESCARFSPVSLVVAYVSLIPAALFSAARAYALSRRRILAFVIFSLLFVSFATNLTRVAYNVSGVVLPMLGCLVTDNFPVRLGHIFTIVNRSSTILADTFLIAMTWSYLPGRSELNSRGVLNGRNLINIMLRDGTLYFILLLMLNILQLVSTELSVLTDEPGSIIAVLVSPISSVLMAHFLLDLQEAYQRKVVCSSSDGASDAFQSLSIRSLSFARDPFSPDALTELASLDDEFVDQTEPHAHRTNRRMRLSDEESGHELRLQGCSTQLVTRVED
ncbi:hypothetical protein BD311DRAFT_751740 [Dichomitus squalens]|uniref:DUF6533 domain-containing protein n=1 Tax=Dichomitus squalens TaxID=114155 RepID=A0A4Q9MWP5_9APHY|nr:hypothetical protein BD311DRAFT_751740 [Dichomitus squalens]